MTLPCSHRAAGFVPGLREDDQLDGALQVLDGHKAHHLVGLGLVRAHRRHHARHTHAFFVSGVVEGDGVVADGLGQQFGVTGQRVVGEIQADQLAFPVEHLLAVDLDVLGQGDGLRLDSRRSPEQGHLPGLRSAEVAGAGRQDAVNRGQHGRARTEAVKRAHFDETFSMARLPAARRSTRRAKSFRSVKEPPLRASKISCTGPSPTFFTAPSRSGQPASFPYRIEYLRW